MLRSESQGEKFLTIVDLQYKLEALTKIFAASNFQGRSGAENDAFTKLLQLRLRTFELMPAKYRIQSTMV